MSGGEKASSTCPNCHSSDYWRDGIRKTGKSIVQRYVCRGCGYRFSESSALSTRLGDNSSRQVCAVLTEEAKNLASVEPSNNGLAGATEQGKTDINETTFKFKWWLKNQGYAESTIKSRATLLKLLMKRGANLHNPESVKEAIANQEWCNKRKMNAVDTYSVFLQMNGGTWNPPRYQFNRKLPFIPQEEELDSLIAGCGSVTSTFLLLLKETGVRCGEANHLSWIDIDFTTATVRVTPEKGSNPRICKLSSKLIGALSLLKSRSRKEHPFAKDLRTTRRVFERQRARIAEKLQNPRLRQIHFHTFRHWKGAMLYHEIKDPIFVMNFLGHKSIKNTLLYIQLEEAIFKDVDKGFVCKASKTIEEATALIEVGFEYVCEVEGVKLFRKRV